MNNFYVGVDVSKGYADFIILNSKKEVVESNFQLDDTFDGHSCLYQRLNDFYKYHPDAQLYAGVESTGGYENNWYKPIWHFQSSLNIRIARLNPAGVNANSKAGLQRIITDAVSARNIAEYLISHPEKVMYEQEDPLAEVRRQWTFIKMLTKQKTQLLNQLNSVLYIACPDILPYCKDGVPQWVLKLLIQYPTSKKLSRGKASKMAQIPYLSIGRANELIKAAKNSVASASGKNMESIIKAISKQILQLSETINEQLKMIEETCTLDEINTLTSFPGIGIHSAIGLLIEIQSVKRFPSVKHMASFFGVHPVYKTSGDGIAGFRMSKQGRKVPREILFNVARNAIVHNPYIKKLYEKYVERGMKPMAAIGVCMHKILRIIYGMLKHGQNFEPKVDEENREKSTPKKAKPSKNKVRRHQPFDKYAPVSGRQAKRRKEWEQSHCEQDTKCGITPNKPSP